MSTTSTMWVPRLHSRVVELPRSSDQRLLSARGQNLEENEMSDFGQKQPDGAAGAPGLPDSPKPHGDKLAGAVRGSGGGEQPSKEAGAPDSAPGTPDSPKPHGDKLAKAVRAAAKGGRTDR
jgi:hypothetical protein